MADLFSQLQVWRKWPDEAIGQGAATPLPDKPEDSTSHVPFEKERSNAMRNMLKAAPIESKFPLLAVEHDCIISKDADITIAFRVELPELFTVTSAEYEAIHSLWTKAIKVLPDGSIVHKAD